MGLDERTRKLLEAYREVEAPSDARQRQLLRALQERIANGHAALPEFDLVAPKIPMASTPLALAKIAWIGAAVISVGSAYWLLTGTNEHELRPPARVSPVVAEHPVPTVTELPPNVETATETPDASASANASAPRATRPDSSRAEPRRAMSPPKQKSERAQTEHGAAGKEPAPQSESSPAGVEAEMRLLRPAHRALRDKQPERALALLEEHRRRFPNGKLSDSRELTRILALCDAGRRELARAEADRFLAAHPASPFAARARSVCRP